MTKVALVTGGNRGIGLGITRRLIADGYAVAILATREEPAELLAELQALNDGTAQVLYVRGSVAEPVDHARFIRVALETWGRIDLLVNNAGVAPVVRDDLLVATTQSYDRVMDINLRGPYFLTQAVANAMINGRGEADGVEAPVGTIINVSSLSADTISVNRGEYCLSKAGLSMSTQLWAARLAPEGIVVYEVRPGVIATDMTAGATERYDQAFANGIAPMSRWGRPSDVAGAVSILASGQTPYSTGVVVNVDGGMHIKRL